jgi:hypothetical protein
MFENVVVGVDGYAASRDAIELVKKLASEHGRVTLVYVEVLQSKPPPEAGTRADAEAQRFGLQRLDCTVAVAPAGYSRRSGGMSEIGVAYDGSAESQRALGSSRLTITTTLGTLPAQADRPDPP